jgi:hypothetical protein
VIEKTFTVAVNTSPIVLGPQYVWVLASYDASNAAHWFAINIASSQVTTGPSGSATTVQYDSVTQTIYDVNGNTWDVSNPAALIPGGQFGCGAAGLSSDGLRFFDRCGGVKHTSIDSTGNAIYLTTLPKSIVPQALASSSVLGNIAVVPVGAGYGAQAPIYYDNEIWLLSADYYNPTGHFVMPDFTVNGKSYQAHGRNVFYNANSSVMYVVMQADNASGLLNDYAVLNLPMSNAPACTATIAGGSVALPRSGGIYTANISADGTCVYTAATSASWIVLGASGYGSGNNTLTYQVRPTLSGGSRSGTISVGGSSLTISQSAADLTSEQDRLSYSVIAAAYSNLVDRVVLVARDPNELHIYNGVTRADQIVALPAVPLSVAVDLAGVHAAVGHDGWISYVNLQTATIEKTVALPKDVAVIAAANGYVYGFSAHQDMYSWDVATGTLTPSFANPASEALVDPSGQYIYLGSEKFDITAGPAQIISSYYGYFCGAHWLSQDGTRLYGACNGEAFTVAADPATPPIYFGSFAGTPTLGWVANSSIQQETAAAFGSDLYGPQLQLSTLAFFKDSDLSMASEQTLPGFSANGNSYRGLGRFAFWSSDASKLFVLEQADPTANLLADYAIIALDESPSPSNCTFGVTTPSSVNGSGGAATFAVTASAPGCHWSTYLGQSAPAILLKGGSGTGNGTVTLQIDANGYGTARSIPLQIAGQSVTLPQDMACVYTVFEGGGYYYSGGGTGSLRITTGPGCAWQATNTQSWLTIQSPASGVGNGTIQYSIAPNATGNFLQDTITITPPGATVFNPGTTFQITVQGTTDPSTSLRFVPVTPCRLVDTRNSNGTFGGPILSANSTRDFPVAGGGCGIPSTAVAYALNVTAVPPAGIGYLTLWPSGQALPATSTLNSDGRVKAAAAIVQAGTAGDVSVYTSDTTHLVLDISGYFVPATDSTALAFYPLTPCRIYDTRISGQGPKLAAQETRIVGVSSSSCSVPGDAQAYSLNFTVVPQVGLGFLSAWPTGKAQPLVSTLNATHAVTANGAIIPAGDNGSIAVYASDSTDVIVDINGYFAPPADGGLSLHSITPCRLLDTRNSYLIHGPVVGTNQFNMEGGCSFPASATSYVLNVTVVPTGSLGYLSIWADGQNQPLVSTLNSDGSVASNIAIVPTLNGGVDFYASDLTQVVLDISGYFAP